LLQPTRYFLPEISPGQCHINAIIALLINYLEDFIFLIWQDCPDAARPRLLFEWGPMGSQSDIELLKRWREWVKALHAEMSARDPAEVERRHRRVETIQHSIAKMPSQGLVGIGVKLALAAFLDGFNDGLDGEPARSAYLDTARLLDRDFLAEAEAIIERSREREVALQEQPFSIWAPAGSERPNSRREQWPFMVNWHTTSPRKSSKS
jgi:hypothetical protein